IPSSSSCRSAARRPIDETADGSSHGGPPAAALDPPREATRRAGDSPADPWTRRIRAAGPRGGRDREPDPAPRLRPAALLRDNHLPSRAQAHRLRTLLLHLLDVPGAPDALSGGSLRASGGAGPRRRTRPPGRAGADRPGARLRAAGMGGPRLEHAFDQVLREARREAQPAVDPDAADRRGADPARALGRVTPRTARRAVTTAVR